MTIEQKAKLYDEIVKERDAGYGDGMHSKACKLSRLRYNKDKDVVLMVLDKKEIDEDFDEAIARHE